MGAVLGFSNVEVYFLSAIILSRAASAMVSPPLCFVVAAGMPSSSRVGTAKSPLGPDIFSYDLSLCCLGPLLISGSGSGCVCSKSKLVSPGSGMDFGAAIGLGTGPIFGPAVCTCVMVIVA